MGGGANDIALQEQTMVSLSCRGCCVLMVSLAAEPVNAMLSNAHLPVHSALGDVVVVCAFRCVGFEYYVIGEAASRSAVIVLRTEPEKPNRVKGENQKVENGSLIYRSVGRIGVLSQWGKTSIHCVGAEGEARKEIPLRSSYGT